MTGDITNQQLLDALTQQLGTITDNMVVRKDVEEIVEDKIQRAVKGLATKDELKEATSGLATKDDIKRLERKISGNHTANVRHHLETRADIGKLNKDFTAMREGLASAAGLT